MEAGGNSKGWISGGTVEGRWQSALESPSGESRPPAGTYSAAQGGEAAQKLRWASGGTRHGGEWKVPPSGGRQEGVSQQAGPARRERDGETPTARAERALLRGKPRPPPPRTCQPKFRLSIYLRAEKAIIRWMLFLKALDSEPAIIFLIT